MAGTLDDNVASAIALLPPKGQEIEFDAYKAKLYAEFPDGGRDAFAHMIKANLVGKRVVVGTDHKPIVMLTRMF